MLVALRARRPDCRTTRSVQQAKLDADSVGNLAHDSAERIDFADEMSLRDAANGWVAGHLRDQIDVQRVERRLQPHACRGHRGLAPCVTRADHDYLELLGELHD